MWGYRVEREAVQVQAFCRDSSKPKSAQYAQPMAEDPFYTAYNLYAEKKGRLRCRRDRRRGGPQRLAELGRFARHNDNAIGTVGVLELACVLAKYDSDRTIRFLFCNEEHTPWTSVTAAKNAKKRGDKIVAVFNIDSIGSKSPEQTAAGKPINVTLYTEPAGKRLAQLMAAVNTRYAIGLEQRAVKRTSPGDDDGSFVKAGYPAAILNIGSYPYADPNYHAEGDVPERSDVPNAAKAVQATLAAILTVDQER